MSAALSNVFSFHPPLSALIFCAAPSSTGLIASGPLQVCCNSDIGESPAQHVLRNSVSVYRLLRRRHGWRNSLRYCALWPWPTQEVPIDPCALTARSRDPRSAAARDRRARDRERGSLSHVPGSQRLEHDGFELNRRRRLVHLAPLAGRCRIAIGDPGEGLMTSRKKKERAPHPTLSPQERGEGRSGPPQPELIML